MIRANCDFKAAGLDVFKYHFQTHFGKEPQSLTETGEILDEDIPLKSQLKFVKRMERSRKDYAKLKADKKKFECGKCKDMFGTLNAFIKHIEDVHMVKGMIFVIVLFRAFTILPFWSGSFLCHPGYVVNPYFAVTIFILPQYFYF